MAVTIDHKGFKAGIVTPSPLLISAAAILSLSSLPSPLPVVDFGWTIFGIVTALYYVTKKKSYLPPLSFMAI